MWNGCFDVINTSQWTHAVTCCFAVKFQFIKYFGVKIVNQELYEIWEKFSQRNGCDMRDISCYTSDINDELLAA